MQVSQNARSGHMPVLGAWVFLCCGASALAVPGLGGCNEQPSSTGAVKQLTQDELQLIERALRQFLHTHGEWLSENYRNPPPGEESLARRKEPTGQTSGQIGAWTISLTRGGALAETQYNFAGHSSVFLHLTLTRGEKGYEVVHKEVARFHGWD